MKKMTKTARIRVVKGIVIGFVGALLMLVAFGVNFLNHKPNLKIWHTADLDEEFTASSPVHSFADYLALEDRLFRQLDEEVRAHIEPDDRRMINRFHRGSKSDPERWSPNWNRSFELAPDSSIGAPKAGVLLIHGLSDSPYSLRNIGQRLHATGAHVVALRVPGHGTAPAVLTKTKWQDMAAAVDIAMRHLREQTGEQPLYVVGYSNGGALAVHYALTTLEDSSLPPLAGIVLISPEIGVTSMASLAIWQERIGRVLRLDKLAWNDVVPEYDPFKYGSFPVNAGNLAYKLTGVNRSKIAALENANKLQVFPPVLAFQSAVDATVSAPALVRDLFARLPENRHELVVFDLNRTSEVEQLLKKDPKAEADIIINDPGRRFTFSVVTNADAKSEEVIVRGWNPGQLSPTDEETGLVWPDHVYSLSHVALPFPGNDPLYGGDDPGESPGIQLGTVALRGEKGVLQVPAGDMLRQRWNPFYPYLERRILDRMGLIGE